MLDRQGILPCLRHMNPGIQPQAGTFGLCPAEPTQMSDEEFSGVRAWLESDRMQKGVSYAATLIT